ncbi:hypothetical protein [Variovorax sp. ZS18.2.2]|uniref:hypothetical protein n=1 Tax=Variovorax sp. ZS18.2.2 TaxID=2971255 RepID=UPI0035ADE899
MHDREDIFASEKCFIRPTLDDHRVIFHCATPCLPLSCVKNWLSLLVTRVRMEGVVVFDDADRYRIVIAKRARYLKDGRMKSKEDVVSGSAPFRRRSTGCSAE